MQSKLQYVYNSILLLIFFNFNAYIYDLLRMPLNYIFCFIIKYWLCIQIITGNFIDVNFRFKMIFTLKIFISLNTMPDFNLIHTITILGFFLIQCELIAPTIVKELANGLDPLKTCEKVKLCTNGTLSTFKEKWLIFYSFVSYYINVFIINCKVIHWMELKKRCGLIHFLCRVWTLIYN